MSRLSRAVQERHAPKEVEADSPERKRWREIEWYATPPFATRAGAELISRLSPGGIDVIWEPACGDGIMAECLKPFCDSVFSSDLCPQSYGETIDFLLAEPHECDWVVSNPPFELGAQFITQGLKMARIGVAMLCRLAFIEGAGRYPVLHAGRHPMTILAPFIERVPMQLGPWNPKCSTATAYAWFIFLKEAERPPDQHWAARVHPIPPGTRARLSYPDDIRRFCKATGAPLLEGGDAVDDRAAG